MASNILTAASFLQERPLPVIAWKLACKVFSSSIPRVGEWKNLFTGKNGIEIGGPSGMFGAKGYLPIYPVVASLDGVNFSNQTLWETSLQEGRHYHYENATGHQYIGEGANLSNIPGGQYDFVLSCNNLEHIANPLKALFEWKRIVNNEGIILLILPRCGSNFDHRRPVTKLQHLISDFENDTQEDDLTHLPEICKLHDLKRDPHAGSFEAFKTRSEQNFLHRGIHHHVFDLDLLASMGRLANLALVMQFQSPTDHFIALSTKG